MRLACFLAATSAAALAQPVRRNLLVSTDWLASHLNDPKLIVLHVTRTPKTYQDGHIPGARLLAWDRFTTTRDGVPVELPPVTDLVERLESLGVSDDTRVVLYGDNLGLTAARAWFTLDYLGHGEHAALLDGGLEKWRAESRPLSQQTPSPARGRLTARPRPASVADLDRVRAVAAGASQTAVLLDTREPPEYLGEKPSADPARRGHIPGAVNLPWTAALASRENPVLRPADELRRMFAAAGAQPGRTLIPYCASGVRASLIYFLARYLGYEAALYDGSVSEWNRAEGAPLILGPSPR